MNENFNETASCFLWNCFQFFNAILFESFFIAELVDLTLKRNTISVFFKIILTKNPFNFTMPKCMSHIEYWSITMHFFTTLHQYNSLLLSQFEEYG